MKRILKSHIPTALALGIVGLLLRLWLFHSGVDGKGLLVTAHPGNSLSYILIAVTIAGFFLLYKFSQIQGCSFGAAAAAAGNLAAAAGVVCTGIQTFTASDSIINTLLLLLSIPAGLSFLYCGVCKLQKKQTHMLLYCLITVYLMLHPISQYQLLSAHPELQYYFFRVLASVALIFTAYLRTCLANGQPCEKRFLLCNRVALALCITAMANGNTLLYPAMALWLLLDSGDAPAVSSETMPLPRDVVYLLNKLENAGFEAYAVGGCVRDHLLGLTPQDHDLCTNATPDKIAALFAAHSLVRSGEKHGTIGVVVHHKVYEITTYRTEGTYSDSRHPDSVSFVTALEEDLQRRDFTVNAMAYNPKKGVIDPFGGRQDLQNKLLRAVGTPEKRFEEDALRILRGVRFAVRFDLTVEEATKNAMLSQAGRMAQLAKERVFDELCKLLPAVKANDLLRFKEILLQVIPELAPTDGFDQQSPHHAYDVFTHTAYVVEATPPVLSLRWAALLHDVEKPGVFTLDENGRGHFYGHAEAGAKTADAILRRLKSPNALREQAVWLIEHHMLPMDPDKKQLRRRLGKYGKDNLFALLELQKADFGSKGVEDQEANFDEVTALLEELLEDNTCLTVSDLAITGRDILALGHKPGPEIGQCMTFLLEKVHDEMLANDKKELLAAAEVFLDRDV